MNSATGPRRVLLLFFDGVGIGPADRRVNPFLVAHLPTFTALGGGRVPTLDAPRAGRGDALLFPLDATLGADGLPQSGTGQTALLTGVDAPRLFGRHFGPWVPTALRPLVRERSVLRLALEGGRTATFANAYPRGWPGPRGSRRVAGPPLAAEGAGLLVRHEEALAREAAVASEIVNDGWRRHLGAAHLPDPSPERAGRTLARIASEHDLTLYAHYATDTAGHRRDLAAGAAALERVDRFLAGVLDAVDGGTLVLITSDHGNVEDVRGGHTRNPALAGAVGPGAEATAALGDLLAVTPFVLRTLGVPWVSGMPEGGPA